MLFIRLALVILLLLLLVELVTLLILFRDELAEIPFANGFVFNEAWETLPEIPVEAKNKMKIMNSYL